jgi:hypothetical protein
VSNFLGEERRGIGERKKRKEEEQRKRGRGERE